MAMVYLSERKISESPKKLESNSLLNNDLRNDLVKLNILVEQKEKENKAPFNIQSKGHDIDYESKAVPGPGSYNLDFPQKIPQNGPNSFLFKSQRFKKLRSELVNPGPGSYNLIGNKSTLRKNKSLLRPSSNISLHNEPNSVSNIATIPAKKQEFGYNINNNGELVLAVDPVADFCFSGTKNNSIGPGRYDPVIKEKNHCIRWDKISGRKSDIFPGVNTENLKNEQTQNSSLVDTDISSLKSSNERYHNINKKKPKPTRMITYKTKRNPSFSQDEEDMIDFKKEFDFLNHKNNIISGPKKSRNYLLNYNIMRNPTKPKELQYFGSSNARDTGLALILNHNTKVGPGSYFRNTYKKFENLFLNKIQNNSWKKSKGRDDNNIHKLRRSLSNLGPGSYNIDRSLQKKSFNSFGNFSTEKRFDLSYLLNNKIEINENGEGNPGPGSYNFNDLWIKDITKLYQKPILVNVEEEVKRVTKKDENENSENKPDFNIYQNEGYINIIQEKIKKKQNPYVSENMPFLSGNNRFTHINKDNYVNIGPGKYDLFKKGAKTRKFNPILAPFNSFEEKKPIYIKKENNNVAPGQHSKDSYFDWNKKSFNAMFA